MTAESYYGLIGLKDIIDDGKYICNYPENPNVDDIVTSNVIEVLKQKQCNDNNKFIYNVWYGGDILKCIMIHCMSEFIVKLKVQGVVVFSKESHGLPIKINPFEFGLPLVTMPYSNVELIILSNKEPDIVLGEYLFLSSSDRTRLVKNTLHFDNVIIEAGVFRLITDYVDPYENVVLTPPVLPDPIKCPEELKPKSWFW